MGLMTCDMPGKILRKSKKKNCLRKITRNFSDTIEFSTYFRMNIDFFTESTLPHVKFDGYGEGEKFKRYGEME